MKKVILLLGVIVFVANACVQEPPYKQGKILYENFCESCHMSDGAALRKLIPPLANSDYLTNHKDELPCLIRNGIEGKIIVNGIEYDQVMPPVPQLTDAEIANVINYIGNNFGNKLGYTPLEGIVTELNKCLPFDLDQE